MTRTAPPADTPPVTPGRLLASAARRTAGRLAAFAVATLAGAAAELLLPAALAAAVDAVLHSGTSGAHAPGPAARDLGLLLALAAVAELGSELALTVSSVRMAADLRGRLVAHTLALGPAGLRRFSAGDLASRMAGDSESAAGAAPVLVGSGLSLLVSAAGLVALFLVDVRLAVVVLVAAPTVALVVRSFARDSSALHLRYRRGQGAVAARLTDALEGIATIRAAGTVAREEARVLAPLAELAAAGRGLWDLQRTAVWRMRLLSALVEAGTTALAGYEVLRGRLTPGGMLAAIGYVHLSLRLVGEVDGLLGLTRSWAGARRLAEVLAEPARSALGGSEPVPPGPGALAFRSVTVTRDGHPVLTDLTLDVPGGTSLAVVGRSGAGKTTLTALIGRLVEPDAGTVLLDGVPLRDIDPARLREQVGYAFERPVLFGRTVGESIALGAAAASEPEVRAAARAAQADGFVRRLPEGYATPLADAAVSGGERQRLGLARALAGSPRVLVLDDATSSLDSVTEAQVGAALGEVLRGRTRILAAHRVRAAAAADRVAWLEDGRLRALDAHHRLWADPEYRAVFTPEAAPAGAAR
ncbi:ABC transporter ATP-binding protein [Kitasatospora sp. NPDC056138]|uniref:ABC transporter ATP-binding protein n=1 Tax=Kitasatospora sp. NPDC056138 TaxID=3345724 RepID=UPI0035DD5730